MAQTAECIQRNDDQAKESDGDSRRTIRYEMHDGDGKSSLSYGAKRTRRSCSRDPFDTRSQFAHTNPANGLFEASYTTTSSEYAAQSSMEMPSLDHTRACTLSVFTDELTQGDIQCFVNDGFIGHLRKCRNRQCTIVADKNLPGHTVEPNVAVATTHAALRVSCRDATTRPKTRRMFAFHAHRSSIIVGATRVTDGYRYEVSTARTSARMQPNALGVIVAT